MDVYNNYPVKYSGDGIPVDYLNETYYSYLHITWSGASMDGNSTLFDFTLPSGNYSFEYSNINFTTGYLNISLSGSTEGKIGVSPYLIVVNYSSMYSWHMYYGLHSESFAGGATAPPMRRHRQAWST
ncbi:hypothetical protein [Thermogymnomonas acidicola]|uniref:hypothetical protein n=1 Tax=Thermogymnomonas acidicola TaxID=399579 RepID=UPI00094662DC|nr:hypothetical protein [Thermogymnomonas acidicola]